MTLPFPAAIVSLCLIFCIGGFTWLRGNPFRGVGAALASTLLLPTWVTIVVLDVELDIRVCVAILAVLVVMILRLRWLLDRIAVADIPIAIVCTWQIFSEWKATGRVLEPFFLSYGYWILPYVAGRCSARYLSDLKVIGYFVLSACCFFGAVSLITSISGFDFFEFVFGEKPGLQFHQKDARRWGLLRCEGPFRHPIFFGAVLVLTLPWSTWLFSDRTLRRRPFPMAGVCLTIIATFCTLSRSGVLGILISTYVYFIIRYRRLLIATIVICGVLVAFFLLRPTFMEDVILGFARISRERETSVIIEGQTQTRSSSMSRLLVLQHYSKAVKHAGMLGYGMSATETFPPNVPHLPYDQVTGKPLAVIDNSYILLTLRGGWLLCLGFVLIHAGAIYQFHAMTKRDPELVSFGRLMIGAICAHAFVVFTVYPDYDFMFVFLWTVGISSIRLHADESEKLGRVSGEPSIAK